MLVAYITLLKPNSTEVVAKFISSIKISLENCGGERSRFIYFPDVFSNNCTEDPFFAQIMQQLTFDSDDCFLCSFDISSLFTDVPLAETIQICADTLYDGDLLPPQFSKEIFIELMNIATTYAEFSFNNVMYATSKLMVLQWVVQSALH